MNRTTGAARWIRRRLLLLGPAAAAAALLALHIARREELRGSARLGLLALVALVEAWLAGVAALALLCHGLHRARRAEARALRRLLEPAERLVAPAYLLLLPVALAPASFPAPAASEPALFAAAPPLRYPSFRPPTLDLPRPLPADAAPPPAPVEPILPPLAELPGGGDAFHPISDALDQEPLDVELDSLALREEGRVPAASLLLSALSPERLTDAAWTRANFDALFRLTAPEGLELFLAAGWSTEGDVEDLEVSPHVGLNLAIRAFAGTRLELSVGATPELMDASLAARAHLGGSWELRAGWRWTSPWRDEALAGDVDRDLSGPFIGLELRF